MCKKCIYLTFFFMMVLVLTQGQAWGSHLAAYWDGRYPAAWAAEDVTTELRDHFDVAGYEILDADQLKTWMDARIADGASSVVVFCRDIVPDTVAETNSSDCTLRKYLDSGGKVVWYSDMPMYYQGRSDGSQTTWAEGGMANILDIPGTSWTNDTGTTVTITPEGTEWGLTTTWTSNRWTPADDTFTVLATDGSGNVAAYAKHFMPGDTGGGFVRIWDFPVSAIPNIEDIQKVAEYGMGGNPYPRRPNPSDGAIHPDTWITLSWYAGDFAVSHDVYLGENYNDVAVGTGDTFRGNQSSTFYIVGFPGFAYPDGLVPGTTYYWRIVEVNDADPNSPWSGPVWSFSIPPKTAYNPNPADGAEFVGPDDVTLKWTAGFGAKLHTVYFGDDFDTVANAAGGMPSALTTYKPGPLQREKTYYWRVDEFDAIATYKGDVWNFTTPGAVGNPQPVYNATDVAMNVILRWAAADSAASHQLYFGTDKTAVRNAAAGAPEDKGSISLGAESYSPGLLDANTDYYWRVDEVVNGSPVKGPIWVFTTGAFLLVDDFESYTDDDAAGKAIWQHWIDGFGVAGNGAQVGYLVPPYCEQRVVHGGGQSMPLLYVNEAGVTNSEGSLVLTAPRDWTQAGVAELSLWFRGGSGNATDPLYVAVANSTGAPAVVAHSDAGAATIRSWTEWRIPLQAFSDKGISLGNVDKIAIGLGSKGGAAVGGTGTMFIDDIRLCQP